MNFYFPKKNIIFIHIKKAGGSSIRRALGQDDKPRQAMGRLPSRWGDASSFAVVRAPVDRFLSAVNMFRMGTPEPDSHYRDYRNPTLPDLTISQALDILEDPEIGYDRRVRKPLHNLKHHLWPQTEPFFCLSQADDILRYETLESDLSTFLARHGLSYRLDWSRRTKGRAGSLRAEDFTHDEMIRLTRIFARDFAELGYTPPTQGRIETPVTSTESPPLQITPNPSSSVWPAYFESKGTDDFPFSDALPAPDAELSVLLDDIIPGGKGRTWPNRKRNILEHFRNLEPEFRGCSRLSHLLACTIVVLRREPANATAQNLFHRLVGEHGAQLAGDLNLRWLASVCDTFLEMGRTGEDRAVAMTGSMTVALVKLGETERRLYYPSIPWPPKIRFRRGGEMFDGVISFWPERGDMIDNLLRRCDGILESDSPAAPFTAEIIARISNRNSSIARFRRTEGMKQPRLANDDFNELITLAIREEADEKVDMSRNLADDEQEPNLKKSSE
ncbi:sulfotransferase family 2 domain-containing protein [Paracoccus saliphilus]|uniref:Sulfotransferase family 2 domain-containing protein n=1 Tax=Paracoccus saliphilus TaxID=405559 RepID=A0AA46A618_9RHOB|nr:sulfotransferase family 2 domain-containing protein [Paracoccus saliphilus]WCR02165.1 sulfotransferase family 2 domain-containing protein [Paracoccus saliphilus]SIS90734.1 Sulfotransferase family protein [Paracoccus saliphilus]